MAWMVNPITRLQKKLRLFKGGRKRDIYEDAKWKKRAIDIDDCDKIVIELTQKD
jgi:hypothetical protein